MTEPMTEAGRALLVTLNKYLYADPTENAAPIAAIEAEAARTANERAERLAEHIIAKANAIFADAADSIRGGVPDAGREMCGREWAAQQVGYYARTSFNEAAKRALRDTASTTTPAPQGWHARRQQGDPFPVPTVPELDDILRKSLPSDVVYAIAPTGDPFVRWARFMLNVDATPAPQAEGLDVALKRRAAELHRDGRVNDEPYMEGFYDAAAIARAYADAGREK